MKKILLATMLLLAALALAAQPFTLPRVYVQRLVLENGENPQITWDGKTSAPEYQLKAWMIERPKDIMTTDKNPINSVAIKLVGDNVRMEEMVIISVQLGNFKTNWKPGETLRLELKHKKTKQKHTWDIVVPEGSNLIKFLDQPEVIPPFAKKKK